MSSISLSLPIGYVTIGLLYSPTNWNLKDNRNASGNSAFEVYTSVSFAVIDYLNKNN